MFCRKIWKVCYHFKATLSSTYKVNAKIRMKWIGQRDCRLPRNMKNFNFDNYCLTGPFDGRKTLPLAWCFPPHTKITNFYIIINATVHVWCGNCISYELYLNLAAFSFYKLWHTQLNHTVVSFTWVVDQLWSNLKTCLTHLNLSQNLTFSRTQFALVLISQLFNLF